jgi:hypothetical protein
MRTTVRAGLDKDPTTYTVSDLTGRVLDTRKAEGQQVRSFHLAISRLQRQPDLRNRFVKHRLDSGDTAFGSSVG